MALKKYKTEHMGLEPDKSLAELLEVKEERISNNPAADNKSSSIDIAAANAVQTKRDSAEENKERTVNELLNVKNLDKMQTQNTKAVLQEDGNAFNDEERTSNGRADDVKPGNVDAEAIKKVQTKYNCAAVNHDRSSNELTDYSESCKEGTEKIKSVRKIDDYTVDITRDDDIRKQDNSVESADDEEVRKFSDDPLVMCTVACNYCKEEMIANHQLYHHFKKEHPSKSVKFHYVDKVYHR